VSHGQAVTAVYGTSIAIDDVAFPLPLHLATPPNPLLVNEGEPPPDIKRGKETMKEEREVAIMPVFADGPGLVGGGGGGPELIPATAKKRSLLYFLHSVALSRYLPPSMI
jgi:hypothetical protein